MPTILCIEDEKMVREDIVEELEELDYTVLVADDGVDGLNMILEHKPDLVICDITMPQMDGFQLLQEVRQKYKLMADMPFIFLSALADDKHVLAGLKEGADNYLTKPVDFDLLKVTVEASLRQMVRIKHKSEGISVLDI
jgi:DNA-binding response OmpR family regulator